MARETTKRKILSEYNFTFPNGPCKSDGYYHLHLHDAHGRTIPRTVKAKTIEELQEKIYQYHRDLLALDLTFGDMFQRAQEDVFRYVKPNSEAYLSKKNSTARRQQHYNRFIQGTRWASMKVRSFTPMDIDELLVYNLQRYDLRSRAFAGLKSIINMTFTYAASHGCIEHNLFLELDMKNNGTNTAKSMNSGNLDVFATPYMVALMEHAACTSVAGELEDGMTTVGTRLDVSHDAATPMGMRVWAESELVEARAHR